MKFTFGNGEYACPMTTNISYPSSKKQLSLRYLSLFSLLSPLFFSGCGAIETTHQYQHNAASKTQDFTYTSQCSFPLYPEYFYPAPGITVSVGEEYRPGKIKSIVFDIKLKAGVEYKLDGPIVLEENDGTANTVIDTLKRHLSTGGLPISVAVTSQLAGTPGKPPTPDRPYTSDIYTYYQAEYVVPNPRPKRLKITIPKGKINGGETAPIVVNFSDVEIKWRQGCSLRDLK